MQSTFLRKRSLVFLWACLLVVNLVVLNVMYAIPLNRANTMLESHTSQLVVENGARWRERMDDFIASMLLIIDNISSSSLVSDMARYDMRYASYQHKAFQAQNYLRDIRMKSSIIEDIYVYIPKRDILLSPNFVYGSDAYYDAQVYAPLFSPASWDAVLQPYGTAQVINIPHQQAASYYPNLMLANSISFHDGNYYNVYIVFKAGSLFDGIRDNATGRDLLAVYDSLGQLLASTGPFAQDAPSAQDLRATAGQYQSAVFGGEKYSLIPMQTKLAGLLLTYATPNVLLFEDMFSLRLTTVVIMALAILLSAVVSLLLGYLNYRPLTRLLQKVQLGRPALEIRNELLALDHYVSDALRENQEYKEINAYTEAMLQDMFLEKLLLFPMQPAYLEANLQRFGLMAHAATLQVALYQLPPQQGEAAGRRLAASVEACAAGAGVRCNHVFVDALLVFLFQFPEHRDTRFILSLLQQAFSGAGVRGAAFYVSDMVTGWDRLPSAYRHALSMYEYAQRTGWQESLFYEDLDESESIRYRYSAAEEQKLLYAIRSGDDQAAHRLVGAVIDRNSAHFIGEVETKCFTNEIRTTLLKAVRMAGPQALEAEIGDLMAQIAGIDNVFDSRGEVEILLTELCACYPSGPAKQNDDLLAGIEALIAQHIWNPNFNVSSIAEGLGLPLSTISKFYKDKTNERLVDHLMALRVKRAMELLTACDDTVEEVASRCGFANIRTFNRVFLSVTGVSPAKYRKICLPQPE